MNFNFFPQRDNRIPNLNASIKAQHKHDPTIGGVRVNGNISEVNTKMGDHLGSKHFVFFSVWL